MPEYRKGRRFTASIIAVGLLVLGLAGYALKDNALEQWYLWKLQSEDEEERRIAAAKLGDMISVRAVPRLMELFRKEPTDGSKTTVGVGLLYSGDALVKIGEPAVPHLTKALKDENYEVRLGAKQALQNIGMRAVPTLTGFLADENHELRESAAEALTIVIMRLRFFTPKEDVRNAIPALVRALKDESRKVRWSVAETLMFMREQGKEAIPPLVEALRDENDKVRYQAALALSTIGVPEKLPKDDVVSTLCNALKFHEEAIRIDAADALGKFRDHSAVKPLLVALKDESDIVRERAAKALGRIVPPPKDGLPALLEALKDQNEEVRENAAYVLGQLGPDAKAATQDLVNLLQDQDEQVRKAAAEALKKIRGESSDENQR